MKKQKEITKHEKNKQQKQGNNKEPQFWRFVKIKYSEIEREKQKMIIVPTCKIALQVGDKFYLGNKVVLKNKRNTKHISILEIYDFIPEGTNQQLIDYFKNHLKNQQE